MSVPSARDIEEQNAIQDLKVIVADFNASFERWRKTFGMVANFSWAYSADNYDEPAKNLEVGSIDRIIYRRPPPSRETLEEAVRGDSPSAAPY